VTLTPSSAAASSAERVAFMPASLLHIDSLIKIDAHAEGGHKGGIEPTQRRPT